MKFFSFIPILSPAHNTIALHVHVGSKAKMPLLAFRHVVLLTLSYLLTCHFLMTDFVYQTKDRKYTLPQYSTSQHSYSLKAINEM